MRIKQFWKAYFIIALVYKIGVLLYSSSAIGYNINISEIFYGIFFLGVFGLSFRIRIVGVVLWRFVFAFAVIVYAHTWIIMPSIFIFSKDVPVLKVMTIMMYSVPLIPLVYGLYIYAWCSDDIWAMSDK